MMDVAARARVSLRYRGTDYAFDYPHETTGSSGADAEASLLYQWTDGNFGCDCNRIPFIEDYCTADLAAAEDVPCGHEVELKRLDAVYADGTVSPVYPDPHRVSERLAALGLVRF